MTERVLYDKTGNIRDVNTVLVPLDKLRQVQLEAARYRWLRDKAPQAAGNTPFTVRGWNDADCQTISGESLDEAIDAALAPASPHKESQNG